MAGIEIERKFLILRERADFWNLPGEEIIQGYLNTHPERTVRVRLGEGRAWLTIKGAVRAAARREYEYPLPVEEARELLALCEQPPLTKIRRRLSYRGFAWEADEFTGANRGLLLAEIELDEAAQVFPLPPWAGREVTGDPRYYNSALVQRPFSEWPSPD
ncbi:MAG: CYTH domain-containing protein [Spirochaetales bacterium]|jgi:adenylate cyclase|nr:CYTH domain-containing protein [Spirochaetales bacterium]